MQPNILCILLIFQIFRRQIVIITYVLLDITTMSNGATAGSNRKVITTINKTVTTYFPHCLPTGKLFWRQARQNVLQTRHIFSFCSLGRL